MSISSLVRRPRLRHILFLALLLSAAPQEGLRVTTDRCVDTSSLDSIVRDVVRLSGAKTNDEKAIAIYDWLHETIFHHAYPVEKSPQSVGPLKVIKVYGWGLCGGGCWGMAPCTFLLRVGALLSWNVRA